VSCGAALRAQVWSLEDTKHKLSSSHKPEQVAVLTAASSRAIRSAHRFYSSRRRQSYDCLQRQPVPQESKWRHDYQHVPLRPMSAQV
jgi:hypothetical protein